MANTPFFSIIIPTLNEEKYLPNLLKDLTKQTFDMSRVEVVHVDGNSDDKTVQVASKFCSKLNLTSLVIKDRNVAIQRNTGAKKAKGEWILFMDADNRLPNYFLDGIKYQIAKNPQYSLVGALIKVDSSNQADRAVETSINLGFLLINHSKIKGGMGGFLCVKRAVCNQIKFDETQKVFEDVFFIKKAMEHGFKYYIFKEPRWFFSLRRFKKEGAIKWMRMVSELTIRYATGTSNFEKNNAGYVMNGGDYYQAEPSHKVLSNLEKYFKSASKRQIKKAKELLDFLSME